MRQGLSPFSMCNRTVSYGKDFTSPNSPAYFSCGLRVRCSSPLTLDYRGQGHQMGFPVSASSCGCCCNCSAGPRATFTPSATYRRRTCSTAHLHNTPAVSRSINSPSTGFSSLNSSIVARVRFTPPPGHRFLQLHRSPHVNSTRYFSIFSSLPAIQSVPLRSRPAHC